MRITEVVKESLLGTFDQKKIRRWRRIIWRVFSANGLEPVHVHAAMVMAAVDVVGSSELMIAELVGVSEDYVRKVLRRLRKQRVLRGHTLCVRWDEPGFEGTVAALLDAMVATGELTRPPDPRRSAAQNARAPETRARGPRTRKAPLIVGAYTPKRVKANPWYGLAEWEKAK